MKKKSKKSSANETESSKAPKTTATSTRRKPAGANWKLDVDAFPPLPQGHRRTLFVTEASPSEMKNLTEKGYQLVDPRTLPRESAQEHAEAIEKWLQGMSEGTIRPNAERRRNLELEAKVHGLLVQRSIRLDAKANLEGATLETMLEALRGADTTLTQASPQRLLAAELAGVTPGMKTSEDKNDGGSG